MQNKNSKWPDIISRKMEKYRDMMFEAERYLWAHPQSGFKEWIAHQYLKGKYADLGFIPAEAGNIPGFYFDIDTGKEGPTTAVIAELDGIILAEHPASDPETGAVHACGHNCQSAALLGVAAVLNDPEILQELCGKIRIMAVPAEELIELGDRSAMKAAGILKSISGKSEFMRRGFFDGVDLAMMIHTDTGSKHNLRIAPGTNGIIAKKVTFYGSKNQSGAYPANGVNALSAMHVATTAINALREVFPEECLIRNASVLTEGGTTPQYIPGKVVIESNVRACEYRILKDINEKINRAYTAGALAVGAEVEIDDLEIYIPEKDCDCPDFQKVAYEVGCDLFGEENVRFDRSRTIRNRGGSDMGNVGAVMPVIQPFTMGITGVGHAVDCQVTYPEYAVFDPAVVQASIACVLLENNGQRAKKIVNDYKPLFPSIAEYLAEMDRICTLKRPLTYDGNNAALSVK